jgi:hypothetical protein
VPALSELQDKYLEATVLGVTAREPSRDAVKAFVAERGRQIRYRIAIEEPLAGRPGKKGGWMTQHWLDASYQLGIPTAFIVERAGRIAWIGHGHPFNFEEPLAAILNETLDLHAKAQAYRDMLIKEKVRERFRLEEEIGNAFAANDTAAAVKLVDEGIDTYPKHALLFRLRKLQALRRAAATKPLALECAAHLINVVGPFHVSLLRSAAYTILGTNFEAGVPSTAIPDQDFARLAVQAMRQADAVEEELPFDVPPKARMVQEVEFARGLIALGALDEAFEHAQRASLWAKEAGASADVLARIDELKRLCRRQPPKIDARQAQRPLIFRIERGLEGQGRIGRAAQPPRYAFAIWPRARGRHFSIDEIDELPAVLVAA